MPRAALPWSGGVDAATLAAAVRGSVASLEVHDLGADDRLWGRAVDDERVALVCHLPPA